MIELVSKQWVKDQLDKAVEKLSDSRINELLDFASFLLTTEQHSGNRYNADVHYPEPDLEKRMAAFRDFSRFAGTLPADFDADKARMESCIGHTETHPTPQQKAEAMRQFFKEWDAIEDEPLGDDFEESINKPWKFNEVDL